MGFNDKIVIHDLDWACICDCFMLFPILRNVHISTSCGSKTPHGQNVPGHDAVVLGRNQTESCRERCTSLAENGLLGRTWAENMGVLLYNTYLVTRVVAWLVDWWVGLWVQAFIVLSKDWEMVHIFSVSQKHRSRKCHGDLLFNSAAVVVVVAVDVVVEEHAGHPSAHLAVAPSLDT